MPQGNRRWNTERILLAAILIAAVILAVQAVLLARGAQEDDSIFKDVKSQYTIEDKQYGELIADYYHEELELAGEEGYDLDCLSVARYADAAFRLKVYKQIGEEEKSEQMRRSMLEARNHMGIYINHTDLIKEELDLVE